MRQSAGRIKGLFVLSVVLAAALFSGLSGSTAFAQQSKLQQQINEPDCTQPGACQMDPPTIDSVKKNGGKPTFKGTYDAAFSRYLRVTFNGKTYVLGIDGELTVQGDEWVLNLSGLKKPIKPGSYVLIVEAEGYDGTIRQARTTVTITDDDDGTDNPKHPGGSGNGDATGGGDTLPDTGENMWMLVGVAVLLLGAGSFLIIWQRTKKRRS